MALYDTLAFQDAVQKGANLTFENDTLIIVTADHAHTMTMAGYPSRGNNILGIFSLFKISECSFTFQTFPCVLNRSHVNLVYIFLDKLQNIQR